jgi:hypothetical protein
MLRLPIDPINRRVPVVDSQPLPRIKSATCPEANPDMAWHIYGNADNNPFYEAEIRCIE